MLIPRKVNKVEAMRYIRVAFSFYGDRMVNCAGNMVNYVSILYEEQNIRYNQVWISVHEGGDVLVCNTEMLGI